MQTYHTSTCTHTYTLYPHKISFKHTAHLDFPHYLKLSSGVQVNLILQHSPPLPPLWHTILSLIWIQCSSTTTDLLDHLKVKLSSGVQVNIILHPPPTHPPTCINSLSLSLSLICKILFNHNWPASSAWPLRTQQWCAGQSYSPPPPPPPKCAQFSVFLSWNKKLFNNNWPPWSAWPPQTRQ